MVGLYITNEQSLFMVPQTLRSFKYSERVATGHIFLSLLYALIKMLLFSLPGLLVLVWCNVKLQLS